MVGRGEGLVDAQGWLCGRQEGNRAPGTGKVENTIGSNRRYPQRWRRRHRKGKQYIIALYFTSSSVINFKFFRGPWIDPWGTPYIFSYIFFHDTGKSTPIRSIRRPSIPETPQRIQYTPHATTTIRYEPHPHLRGQLHAFSDQPHGPVGYLFGKGRSRRQNRLTRTWSFYFCFRWWRSSRGANQKTCRPTSTPWLSLPITRCSLLAEIKV